jgi:Leucine-rich repeat (LRR) protein
MMSAEDEMVMSGPGPGNEIAHLANIGVITSMARPAPVHAHVHEHVPLPRLNEDSSEDGLPTPPMLESAADRLQRPGAVYVPTRAPFVSNQHHHQWRRRMNAHLWAPFRSTRRLSVSRQSVRATPGGGGGGTGGRRRSSILSRLVSTRRSWVFEDADAIGAACEVNDPTPEFGSIEEEEGDIAKGIALICLGGLILITIVVLVILGVSSNGDDNLTMLPPASKPTSAPTLFSAGLSERELDLQIKLREYSLDPSASFADPLSPQSVAIAWLAHADGYASQDAELEMRYALACFYFATVSPKMTWTNDLRFLSPASVCQWNDQDKGVFCDDEGNVVQLILGQYLSLFILREAILCIDLGLVSSAIFSFSSFLKLDEANNLQGSIPEEIKLLASHLEIVRISYQLQADQPDLQQIQQIHRLGALTNLQILDLSHNQLGGGIPSSFAELVLLNELYLNDNQLVGQLQDDMQNIQGMKVLHLHNNKMTGSANPGVHRMTQLEELRMDGNRHRSGGLQSVEDFWLSLTQLRVLNLSGVYSTTKFRALGRLSSLEVFHWDDGKILGTLPPFTMPNLTSLSLHNNALTGSTIPWTSLTTNLQYLDLGLNRMGGFIPSTTVEQLVNLEYMDVAGNDLSGMIPATALASLTKLEVLKLNGNVNLVANNLEPLCLAARPEGTTLELTVDCFSVTNCSCCGC